MLSEAETRERAHYCCCVLKQMGWLYGNSSIPPSRYIEYLNRSSLGLAEDEFLTGTLEEAARQGSLEQGLRSIINTYEGLVLGLCEVLETDMERLEADMAPDTMKRLAEEMDVSVG